MSEIIDLIKWLDNCPAGKKGWREFEDLCVDILKFLFVPPLVEPKIQSRTYSGINRRDAVFPNRNFEQTKGWGLLLRELNARMVLFEFKNYDLTEIGKEEVIQTDNYSLSHINEVHLHLPPASCLLPQNPELCTSLD